MDKTNAEQIKKHGNLKHHKILEFMQYQTENGTMEFSSNLSFFVHF